MFDGSGGVSQELEAAATVCSRSLETSPPSRGGAAALGVTPGAAVRRGTMRLLLTLVLFVAFVASGCSSHRTPLAVQATVDCVASYTVTFTSTWSASSHPVDFPANAHFSGLIGATHDDRVRFWREGELASAGIQAMAELGSKT